MEQSNLNNQKYKILIIAGGGAFGLIPSYFISKLKYDNVADKVDVLGGTSVGSLLVCAYASGTNGQQTYTSFKKDVLNIFKPSLLPTLRGARYDTKVLQKSAKRIIVGKFGDLKKPVVVPVLDFKNRKFKVYDNIIKDADCDYDAYRVACQSGSAPTYFELLDGCSDGGMIENIPIMTTATAVNDKLHASFANMSVLAIGTGFKCQLPRDMKKVNNWWIWDWLDPLLAELTASNERASVFWAERLKFKYFKYFNPVLLDDKWVMDKPQDYIDIMEERCNPYVEDFKTTFDAFINS
jgi:patatin-like phospholipase/acyl hydrolase